MELVERIIKILDEKKAMNIKKLDVKEDSTIADYFVVATGTSSTHVKALADNVEETLKKENIYPNKIEGYNTSSWILMDYSDVIIHLFTEKERENYNLEELWENTKEKMNK
ncbi:MAG: ribosome silencing factor [Clostridia bacterium]|nr:ribosome silencing factor [Clostridia bacterium]